MEKTVNQEVKSKKDLLNERLRGKYPDKDFSNEEVFYGQISDDYDDYDNRMKGYEERETALSNMFTSDPRSARFLTEWREGGDPIIGLVRQFGTDIKEAIDDPERQEAIAEANKEFVERVAKEKELEDEYQANLQESLSVLEQMQQEKGLSDEQIDDAMEFIINIVKDGVMGKFSAETIEMAMKAKGFDEAVAAAEYEGEVRGRNANITEKLKKNAKGDGTAQIDGQNRNGGQPRQRGSLGALDNYGDNLQTIWERGGEKRTPVRR